MEEEEWDIEELGEYESCDEDYISDEDDEEDDETEEELSTLSEQDRQRAMGMTVAQLRLILPQEEGTVWRISGQRLEKITASSNPPVGVFESAEVIIDALSSSYIEPYVMIGFLFLFDVTGLSLCFTDSCFSTVAPMDRPQCPSRQDWTWLCTRSSDESSLGVGVNDWR